MQVSLSPKINRYNSFQAQKSQKTTNVLDSALNEKDKLEIQSKRVKNAVKCCLGVVLFMDILYFAMKRNFKFAKIAKVANRAEKLKSTIAPLSEPPSIF